MKILLTGSYPIDISTFSVSFMFIFFIAIAAFASYLVKAGESGRDGWMLNFFTRVYTILCFPVQMIIDFILPDSAILLIVGFFLNLLLYSLLIERAFTILNSLLQ